ncbi:MAG: hypothetical protein Q9225_004550 [Loekoesia sp. 1 TL-2023]
MSDNLATSKQEAAAQAGQSATSAMADPTTTVAQLAAAAEIDHNQTEGDEIDNGADTVNQGEDADAAKEAGAGALLFLFKKPLNLIILFHSFDLKTFNGNLSLHTRERQTNDNLIQAKAGKGTKATKTSPKKRTTAGNDEDGSPKKKRAPAKAKAATDESKNKKKDVNGPPKTPEPDDDANVKPESADDEDIQVPVTPMKGKRNSNTQSAEPKTPRTPKTPKNGNAIKEKNKTPTPKSTPRRRSTSDKVADKVSLPSSWAAAGEADRELVAMKKRGESWNEIRGMWFEKTGQDTATSTLPNR